jgi:hypothetical protein
MAEVDVLSIPIVPDPKAEEEARRIFEGPAQMIRDSNPECPGSAMALVVSNNLPVQARPNTLARMDACRQKQVAFNERVLQNENKVAAMNSGMADFLAGFDPTTTSHVVLGIGGYMR